MCAFCEGGYLTLAKQLAELILRRKQSETKKDQA